MWKFLLALALQPLLFIFADFVIEMSIYICQEINHTVRKIIREIKSFWRVV
jgi:hypothetical protein